MELNIKATHDAEFGGPPPCACVRPLVDDEVAVHVAHNQLVTLPEKTVTVTFCI